MEQIIGSCSLCGGDVVCHVGGWWSTEPPPPDRCSNPACGARRRGDIIDMIKPKCRSDQ